MVAKKIPDIVWWAEGRYGFYVDRTYQNDKWHLGAAPIRLADYHKRILRHCFTPDADGRMPYDTVAICEPAKSGKSALAALVHEYFALHIEPGSEQFVVSNKRDQSQTKVYRSLADSIAFNKHLPRVDPNRYECEFNNGTIVRAVPSNSRTEAGARYSLVSFDEPWGYVFEDMQRLIGEFKRDPTRNVSVKLFIGTAGYFESKMWFDLLNKGLSGEPVLTDITNDGAPACYANDRLFTFWSHECRQPWQSFEWQKGEMKSLRPAEYRRLIANEFAEGTGDFVEQAAWLACFDPQHEPLPPHSDVPVYVGMDLALSPKGDDSAVIGVYPAGDGKVALAFHKVWRGRERRQNLKLGDTVKPFLLQAARDYRIAGLYYDPYQAVHLVDELQRAGLRCVPVQQTHSTRAPKDTELYQMVCDQRLVLYDHPDLVDLAAGTSAKELGNGLIFLTKRTGPGKIDLMVALSNCANEAARGSGVGRLADVRQPQGKSRWNQSDPYGQRAAATDYAPQSRWNVGTSTRTGGGRFGR